MNRLSARCKVKYGRYVATKFNIQYFKATSRPKYLKGTGTGPLKIGTGYTFLLYTKCCTISVRIRTKKIDQQSHFLTNY